MNIAVPPPLTRAYAIVDTAEIIQSSDTVGFADSQLYGETPAEINANLDLLQSTGSNTVRIDIPWAGVEPLQGTYDWSEVDDIVQAAESRGMAIDADINSTPYWAATSGTPPISGPPASDAAYAAFASQVATRYAGQISSYEIWNEPNSAQFWSTGPDAAAYTALLKAAYPAIKAADPSALVVAGAVGSVIDFGNLTENPVEFLSKVYADGGGGFFDALSFHPYSPTLEFSQGADVPNSAMEQLAAIRQLMVANGDSSKLIWATEYGLETSQVSQQTQATYISDFLNSWAGLSYVGPQFIYTVEQTTAADTADPSDTYGVFNVDGTPTPAEQAIAAFIAAHPLTITPPTPPVTTNPQQAFAAALAAFVQQVMKAYVTAFLTALSQAFTTPATTQTTAVAATVATDAKVSTAATAATASTTAVKTTAKTTAAATTAASGTGATAVTDTAASADAVTPSVAVTTATTPGQQLQAAVGGVGSNLQSIAGGIGKNLEAAVGGTGSNVEAVAGGVGTNVQAAAGGLGNNVQTAAGGLGKNVQAVLGGIGKGLQAASQGTTKPNATLKSTPAAVTSKTAATGGSSTATATGSGGKHAAKPPTGG